MGDDDELDDLLDDGRANLEARFRELEREAEIDRLRQRQGPAPAPQEAGPARAASTERSSEGDDLADIKAALDDERPLERYVLLLCPHCDARNRTSLTRLRSRLPRCGGCKGQLSFTQL